MPSAIIDSSVYVDHWESVLDEQALAWVRSHFIVRQSSVVISELRRGARTAKAKRLVEDLRRLSTVEWTPNADDWWKAGAIIQKIGDAEHWDRRKRQEFQNDVLIALSARRHGAVIVTSNRGDFEILAKKLRIEVLFVA